MLAWLLACSPELPMELQAQGALAARATVEVPEEGRLWIELRHPTLEPLRTLPQLATEGPFELDVLGLRGNHTYSLCPVLELGDGRLIRGEPQDFHTQSPTQPVPEVEFFGETTGVTLVPVAPRGKGEELSGAFLVGLDPEGEVVWEYTPEDLSRSGKDRLAQLLDDGSLLVLTGRVETVSPTGELLHAVEAHNRIHHDALRIEGGHTLGLVGDTRELYVESFGEIITVTGDAVLELDEAGEIAWEWNAFDHLDIERYPGTLAQTPLNGEFYSWTHANSLQQFEDWILVSMRHQNQVIAIDHASGEVAWTFGEEGDFRLTEGRWFTSQHAARLEGDELLMVDNGNDAGLDTRVVVYELDFEAMEAREVWTWQLGWQLLSMGEADRLESGNLLVTAGGDRDEGAPAELREVDSEGQVVWGLDLPGDDFIYRGERVVWTEPLDP